MSDPRKRVIRDVARKIGTRPEWLDALINFETAGTYNPRIKNPHSSARGLIQFIDSTARSEFGVSDSLALVNKYPDFESQMYNAVLPYLKKYAPYPTKQKLYMAVFYPKYMNVAPDTPFPESVRKVNRGISTPQDYINFVDRRVKNPLLPKSLLPILLILGIGGVSFYLWKTANPATTRTKFSGRSKEF